MKIYLGSDHNGFHLKNKLEKALKRAGYDVDDEGSEKLDPKDDFTVFAAKVVTKMKTSEDKDPRGILICGSGQGMAIAANRHNGIRAVLAYDRESARSARNDDDVNVLALPAHLFGDELHEVLVITETFLNTPFANAERFRRRIRQLDQM